MVALLRARSEMQKKEIEVERQRLGLVPRTVNPEKWTIADLLRWWLDEYSRHLASHSRNESAIRKHLLDAPLAAKKLEHVPAVEIEGLLQSKQGDIGPHRRSTTFAGSSSAPSTRRSSAASGSA